MDFHRRTPQQRPAGDRIARQQQMAGSNEFQHQAQPPQAGAGGDPPQQMGGDRPQQKGEGSYEATRDYQQRTERYLDQADVRRDAEAAKPRSEEEARELEQAEKEGRSHSRGER